MKYEKWPPAHKWFSNMTGYAKRGLIAFSIVCIYRTLCDIWVWKFGHLTLLTWFYSWEQFYINRLNTLWVATNWSWKLRKATIRPLSADLVTNIPDDKLIVLLYYTVSDCSIRVSRSLIQDLACSYLVSKKQHTCYLRKAARECELQRPELNPQVIVLSAQLLTSQCSV